jgi:hypothetical protein
MAVKLERSVRDEVLLELTRSICPVCNTVVDAELDDCVALRWLREHPSLLLARESGSQSAVAWPVTGDSAGDSTSGAVELHRRRGHTRRRQLIEARERARESRTARGSSPSPTVTALLPEPERPSSLLWSPEL